MLPMLALLLAAAAGAGGISTPPAGALTPVFTATGAGVHNASTGAGCFRSPTLLRVGSSLLAFAAHHWDTSKSPCNDVGLKAIVVRDSRDGKSWSPPRAILNDTLPSKYPGDDGISFGTAVYDTSTRTVFFFYVTCSHVPGRAAPAPAHCPHSKFVLRSTDEGVHWSAPQDVTSMLATIPGIWAPGPATGIQLPTGRLLVCGSYRPMPKYSAKPPVRSISQCITSDDHGAAWRVAGFSNYSGVQGTATDHEPNEVQPALLANGSVLLNSRDVGKGHGHRLLTLSTDGGHSFGPARAETQLYDYPSTEGSMIRLGDCLFVTNLGEDKANRRDNDPCETPPAPSPCAFRHNLTLHSSCDEAKTWQSHGALWAGPAAYSSLASLPWRSDAVGVLFESGPLLATDTMAPYRQLSFVEAPVESTRIKNDEDETVWHAAPRSDGGAASVVAALHAAGEAARLQNRVTTVQLASGRYQLREPLEIPSGVSLLGAKNGDTVLSGGVTITGWLPAHESGRPWLWRAPLSPPLRGAFREFSNGPRKEGWANGTTDDAIRQLWVSGQRRGVARTKLLRYLSVTANGIVVKPGQLRHSYNSSSVRAVTYQHWTAAPRTVAGTANVICPADKMPSCLNKTCPVPDNPCNQLRFTEPPYPFTGNGCGDKEGTGRRYYLQNSPEFLRPESGTFFADGKSIFYSPFLSELAGFRAGTVEVVAARPGLRTLLHGGESRCFPLLGPEYTDEQLARCGQNASNTMHAERLVIEHTDTDELPCLGGKKNLCTGQAASHIPSAAVHFMFATNVHLRNLTVRHVGGWGVWLGAGTRNCLLEYSTVSDTGAGGARVGEAGSGACVPAYSKQGDYWCNASRVVHNATLSDNVFTEGSKIWPEAPGILLQVAHDSTLTHNEISRYSYSGISTGWSWTYGRTRSGYNVISHNNISTIGQGTLCDLACVYHLGQDNGTQITNNLCSNVSSYGYGGNAFYTDQGSSNVTIANNVAHDVKCAGFMENYGYDNNISNNVFAFVNTNEFTHGADFAGANCLDGANDSSTTFRSAAVACGGTDWHKHLPTRERYVFLRNIIYGSSPNLGNGSWGSNWGVPFKVKVLPRIQYTGVMMIGTGGIWGSFFDRNLYWSDDNAAILRSRGFMCNSSNPPGQNWPGCSFQSWQTDSCHGCNDGHDKQSKIADPLFVNPTKRDFRLRPDSPALAMGIASIVSDYGPRPQTMENTCQSVCEQFCVSARRASVGNCFVCCQRHSHAMQAAGCTRSDCDRFCPQRTRPLKTDDSQTTSSAMLLHLLLLAVHYEPVAGRVIGITSDMESKFTPSFIAVLQEQVVLAANYNRDLPPSHQELPLRVSIAANTDWAWREAIEAPNNGGRSRMERAMEVVDELILMDYTATCHRPGTDSADSPCNPHEFLQQAYPFFAHSRLLKSRSDNHSHEVLVSLALEVFGDPQPDPTRTRGGWQDHRIRTAFELESFLNKSGSWLGPPNPRGTIQYYGCYNLFDEWCPFHIHAIFEHTNYYNITSLWPCPPDETVCDSGSRLPRSSWLYDVWRPLTPFDTVESDLLFDARQRHAFIGWCHEQHVNELYLNMQGLPGCDHNGNASTAAALLTLFEELDAASIDIQMFVGDVLGSGCPSRSGCEILNCTRASLDFARQLRNRSSDVHLGQMHLGSSRSKTDDDQERFQGGVVQMMRNVSTYNSSASSQPNIKWIVLAPEGPLSIPASDACQGLQTALNHSILYGYDLKVFGGTLAHNGPHDGSRDRAVINCVSTLHIPSMQKGVIYFGGVTLNFGMSVNDTWDGLVFDGGMMLSFDFHGQVVYPGRGNAVLVRPTKKVPLDGFVCVVDSRFYIHTIAAGRTSRAALAFDTTLGGIGRTRFSLQEINSGMHGILIIGGGGGFMGNTVEAWIHGQSVVGVTVGGPSQGGGNHGNTFRLKIEPGPRTTALQVWDSDNRFELDVLGCEGNQSVPCEQPYGLGAGVIWEKSAQRNTLWPGLMENVPNERRYIDRSEPSGSNRVL